MTLPRSTPTPRAQRIWEEIEMLTLYDLLYLRDQFRHLLGGEDKPDAEAGVREPRRPNPDAGGAVARIEREPA